MKTIIMMFSSYKLQLKYAAKTVNGHKSKKTCVVSKTSQVITERELEKFELYIQE